MPIGRRERAGEERMQKVYAHSVVMRALFPQVAEVESELRKTTTLFVISIINDLSLISQNNGFWNPPSSGERCHPGVASVSVFSLPAAARTAVRTVQPQSPTVGNWDPGEGLIFTALPKGIYETFMSR